MHGPVLGHITTFGGHPVNCAAALATLETLMKSNLINLVNAKERAFLDTLIHPSIKEIRSAGLLIALELENNVMVQRVIKSCLEKGLITDWFLFNDRSLRICPPLIITIQEIHQICSIILESINDNS
jgi:acetylornithine/N-succinyldiaminopimelate aminotransferase